ncbi:MAG: hypothetical protein LBB79_00285 [Prevotellaceae bacterium]|jgi:hypothetical protein|nr:hypothetical protein [Prevotellaceae bacterium]
MTKKLMKNSVTTLAAFLLMLMHNNASATVAMSFSDDLKSIPFGKTNTEIITWLEDLKELAVYEDRAASVNKFFCFSALQPFFSSGVQKNKKQEPQFHSHFVKKYIVERCHSAFPYTFRLDLYFVRGTEQKYTLLMAHRVCRVESGAMKDIFRQELEAREKKFGNPDNVWKTFYGTCGNDERNESALPARVAQYINENGYVFFMMNDNGMLQFKEFLYVCSEGWSSYLRQLERGKERE